MARLLFIIIGTLLLFGCSKGNNPSSQTGFSITGKWYVKADTSRSYVSGLLSSTYVIVGINSPYYQFNSDGTGSAKNNISTPDAILNFTFILSDKKITFNYPQQPANGLSYAYNITGVIEKESSNSFVILFDSNSGVNEYKEVLYLNK
jgi:hypothetical protein